MTQFMQENFSGYGFVLVNEGEVPTKAVTTFSPDWHQRYFREQFHKIDPVFDFNASCGSRSAAKLLQQSEMASPLFEEAKAAGANSNFVSVSVFGGSRLIFGGVNHDLDSSKAKELHEKCKREHRMILANKISDLSDDQVDFLELCEEGMLDKQIASELSITVSAIAQRKKVICQRIGTSSFRSALSLYTIWKWHGLVPE